MCKHCEVFSLQVLIGRGLDLLLLVLPSLFMLHFFPLFIQFLGHFALVGVIGCEVPPVPIPNTEVKLTYVEDTWLATTRENRAMPTHKTESKAFVLCFPVYSSVAQSVVAPDC